MAEYQLKLGEEEIEETRQRTLKEIHGFIETMHERPLAIVTLDQQQSMMWDHEGEVDYQDEYGRQIVASVSEDGVSETLVVRDINGMPVALACRVDGAGWQGIGIDKRLRLEVATMLLNDEAEFE